MQLPMAQTTDQFLLALNLIQQDTSLLWPAFIPSRIPFLVFDGQDSLLFQADPPLGDAWQRQKGYWRHPGRHPQLRANTAVLLDEVLPVATVLLSDLPDHLTSRQLAAFAVHEAFHVYQGQHPSPAWNADELSGLTYPVGDEPVLVARAMETMALHRALQAGDDRQDWAAVALGWRHRRFARLSAAHQEYERALERVEGLAHHVERRFLNEPPQLEQPDVPAEQIRHRTYTVGAAYAALLDRWVPEWPVTVQSKGVALDVRLVTVVTPKEELAAVPKAIGVWARQEAQQVLQRQTEALKAFEAQPGQRLTLTVADGEEPIWPRGFDPLNLQVLADGSLLHTRFLQFGNSTVRGEVLGSTCRTWGAGTHPFASGFRRIELVDGEGTEADGGPVVSQRL